MTAGTYRAAPGAANTAGARANCPAREGRGIFGPSAQGGTVHREPGIRARAVVEYDGTAYRGWQRQPDAPTVQEVCEAALGKVLGERADVVCSGRTDTGVHARGQVVHFDHPGRLAPRDLRRAWNAGLPDDVWIRSLAPARDDFHARYDAVGRTYRYHLATGARAESPFVRRYAWPIRRRLDWGRMEDATRRIVGAHDFRRFAKGERGARTRPGGSPGRCRVTAARWRRSRTGRTLEITADRFLRHMVRSLVGALVAVGHGRVTADEIEGALGPDGDRTRATYAPPAGLFLWRVDYEGDEG